MGKKKNKEIRHMTDIDAEFARLSDVMCEYDNDVLGISKPKVVAEEVAMLNKTKGLETIIKDVKKELDDYDGIEGNIMKASTKIGTVISSISLPESHKIFGAESLFSEPIDIEDDEDDEELSA